MAIGQSLICHITKADMARYNQSLLPNAKQAATGFYIFLTVFKGVRTHLKTKNNPK